MKRCAPSLICGRSLSLGALVGAVIFLAATGPLRADPDPSPTRAWGCVVYAHQGDGPSAPELESHLAELKRIFGYTTFDIIGSAWSPETTDRQTWVSPTKEFYLQIAPARSRQFDSPTLHVTVWQHNDALLRGKVVMPPSKPLFIRVGPHDRGELLVVLELRPKPPAPPSTNPAVAIEPGP